MDCGSGTSRIDAEEDLLRFDDATKALEARDVDLPTARFICTAIICCIMMVRFEGMASGKSEPLLYCDG